MSRKLEFLLEDYGDFVATNLEFYNEIGENVLYRYAQFGYTDPTTGQMRVDDDGHPLGRDSVLCPDMPARLQKVDVALHKIDDLRRNCVRCAFCLPLRDDGQRHTVSQMARMLRINKGKFRAELRKGKSDLDKLL